MTDEPSAQDPVGEDARIDALDERLKALRQRSGVVEKPVEQQESDANYRLGNRVLSELLGGLAGGVFLGWLIDHFAGTSPWGLVVMIFFGIFVAFRNIIRITNRRPN